MSMVVCFFVFCFNGENIWSNYSDLTRPHPKWWFSKGNPLISGKSRLVKYYNLARNIGFQIFSCRMDPKWDIGIVSLESFLPGKVC